MGIQNMYEYLRKSNPELVKKPQVDRSTLVPYKEGNKGKVILMVQKNQ